MTDDEKNPKHSQAQQDLEQHEVKQVLNFLKHYGKLMGIGILAAAVFIIASRGLAGRKANKMAQAEELLTAAQTPQQLEKIVGEYSATPAAPVALLSLAKIYFNDGDYFKARAQYERFLKEYKKNELCAVADFGLASCTEADGDFSGAVELFTEFVETRTDHYLSPLATLGLARSLDQAKRTDEARIVLEDFLAGDLAGQWAGQAETALQQLGK
jgi:predicted negative regulator of RcsB-dependent stress response